MIEHDHIHATPPNVGDLGNRRGAAIDRNQELRATLLQTALNAFTAQAVAFLHPKRQEQFGRGAIRTQHFRQQRNRRHSIDIVIAKKDDPFTSIHCAEHSLDSRLHIWKQKRIAQ